MEALVLTGWGWKEYAVAAAVALKALGGKADVMGMSKRRLPEFLDLEGHNWKRIFLIGLSLGGDEARLAAALKSLRCTKVTWISSLPMSESQARLIAPLLDVRKVDGGLFDGSLVKAVGNMFGVDVAPFLPFAVEGERFLNPCRAIMSSSAWRCTPIGTTAMRNRIRWQSACWPMACVRRRGAMTPAG